MGVAGCFPFCMNRWVNFLSLLPGTSLTLLVISIAFLRVYDETDFLFLGYLANARLWSNRLTVAALLVALVNFGIVELRSCEAWDRRNCLKTRCANKKQIAALRKSNADLKKSNADLRKQNERLAELESKIDGSFSKHGIYSALPPKSKQP
jgi:hypothetical protein